MKTAARATQGINKFLSVAMPQVARVNLEAASMRGSKTFGARQATPAGQTNRAAASTNGMCGDQGTSALPARPATRAAESATRSNTGPKKLVQEPHAAPARRSTRSKTAITISATAPAEPATL